MVTTRRGSRVSSEREKWDKVFNSLLQLVKDLQSQNDTLLQQRKSLENLVKTQQERWSFDVRLLEDLVSEMKDALVGKDKELVLAGRKCDLLTALKQREFSLWKLKSECAEDELADLKEMADYLFSAKSPTRNLLEAGSGGKGQTRSGKLAKSADCKMLKAEVKRLKLENEQLSSEISVLLKEKSFVWHQYNLLEINLSNKLKCKQVEAAQANEKISLLLARMEQLHSSNNQKDEQIVRLRANMTELEVKANRWKDEVSKLSEELELLRKSRGAQVTPGLNHCSAKIKYSILGNNKSQMSGSDVHVKKEPTPVQFTVHSKDAEKGGRGSKRKRAEVIVIADTPKLFSSAFKVPKLKTRTPR